MHYEKFADGTIECIEDEIPYELPEGWSWSRFRVFCPYGDCEKYETSAISDDSWILDLEDIEKNTGRILAYVTKSERNAVSTKHKFYKGQVLYSKLRPYLNKVVIAPKDGYCTSEILPLKLYDQILPKYVQLFLMSGTFLSYVNMISYGVKMPRLGTEDGKKALIALPPLQEQVRIAEKYDYIIPMISELQINSEELSSSITTIKSKILDLAIQGKLVPQDPNDEPASVLLERIRAEKEELIKHGKIKRDKKESIIFKGDDNSYYENLPEGWAITKLGLISSVITKGTTPRGGNVAYLDNGIGFLRAENIEGYDKLNLQNLKFIDETTHNGFLKRSILQNDDILITIAGTLGRTAIVTDDVLPLNTNQAVAIVRLVNPLLVYNRFIAYAINSNTIKKTLLQQEVAMAIPNLSLENIHDCVVPIPPLNEQLAIVDVINEVFVMIDDIEKSLN